MRIVGRERVDEFLQLHADARPWIENWIADVEASKWATPQDIKAHYATASFLPDRVVIFNVKGNHYRLEVQVAYNTSVIVIRWMGTHAEYSKRTT